MGRPPLLGAGRPRLTGLGAGHLPGPGPGGSLLAGLGPNRLAGFGPSRRRLQRLLATSLGLGRPLLPRLGLRRPPLLGLGRAGLPGRVLPGGPGLDRLLVGRSPLPGPRDLGLTGRLARDPPCLGLLRLARLHRCRLGPAGLVPSRPASRRLGRLRLTLLRSGDPAGLRLGRLRLTGLRTSRPACLGLGCRRLAGLVTSGATGLSLRRLGLTGLGLGRLTGRRLGGRGLTGPGLGGAALLGPGGSGLTGLGADGLAGLGAGCLGLAGLLAGGHPGPGPGRLGLAGLLGAGLALLVGDPECLGLGRLGLEGLLARGRLRVGAGRPLPAGLGTGCLPAFRTGRLLLTGLLAAGFGVGGLDAPGRLALRLRAAPSGRRALPTAGRLASPRAGLPSAQPLEGGLVHPGRDLAGPDHRVQLLTARPDEPARLGHRHALAFHLHGRRRIGRLLHRTGRRLVPRGRLRSRLEIRPRARLRLGLGCRARHRPRFELRLRLGFRFRFRRGQRGRLPLWTRHLFGDRWLRRAGDRGPQVADLEGTVEDGPGRSGREGLGALALLEQDDRATQEAAVEHGEGPLVEGRGHVDDDHVGVADDAVEVLAVPVDHADPAGGLDQGAEGTGEHVVPRDQDDPEGGALGTRGGLAGPRAGARERGALGAVGADRLAGPRLGAGRGWLGGRGGAAPAALGPVATVAHRAAPAPSETLVAETTRLSR